MKRSPGIRALLDLEESKYSIEQIAAKTGNIARLHRGLCG